MSYLIRFDAKSNRICIKYILRFLSINSKNGNASTFFWVKRDIQSEKKTSPRRNVLKNSIWFAVDQCNWLKQWKWSFLHVKEVKFNLKEKTSRWTRNEPIFFLNSSNFDKLYLWCLVFRVFVFYSFIFLFFFQLHVSSQIIAKFQIHGKKGIISFFTQNWWMLDFEVLNFWSIQCGECILTRWIFIIYG